MVRRRRARAKPAAVVDRIASGHNVPVHGVAELAEDVLGGPMPGVALPPPHVELRHDAADFPPFHEDPMEAFGSGGPRAEAFAGIDRSAAPMSLQHMAPQQPLTPELMREAARILHQRRDHRADPDPPCGDLARLEVRTAERDRALELLDAVERLVARIGGFMSAEDQDLMREVRAALAGSGRRVDERPLWADRR